MPRDDKDIIMKALTGALSHDALDVIGIQGLRARKPLPTELDTMKQTVDMLWQLEDKSLFHLEFQTNRESNLRRFLLYDARLAYKYKKRIRTVVLYHGRVNRAPSELSIGTAEYRVENVYLGQFDRDAALDMVERRVNTSEWAETDRWRLALALAMHFKRRTRREAFETVITLVQTLEDQQERDYVAAAILGLTERVMTESERRRMKRELGQVSQIAKEIHDEALQEGRMEEKRETARKALKRGMSVRDIADLTGLSADEVRAIGQRLH